MRNESIIYIYRYVSHASTLNAFDKNIRCDINRFYIIQFSRVVPTSLDEFNSLCASIAIWLTPLSKSANPSWHTCLARTRGFPRGAGWSRTPRSFSTDRRDGAARSHRRSSEPGTTSAREHPRGPLTGGPLRSTRAPRTFTRGSVFFPRLRWNQCRNTVAEWNNPIGTL